MSESIWGNPIWTSQRATGSSEPPPPPTNGGDGNISEHTAATSLGGKRAVYSSADGLRYASSADSTGELVIGFTTAAFLNGETAFVKTSGEIQEPSWNWDIDEPIWLGLSGLPTQSPPNTGVLVQLGIATKSDIIQINIQRPVFL